MSVTKTTTKLINLNKSKHINKFSQNALAKKLFLGVTIFFCSCINVYAQQEDVNINNLYKWAYQPGLEIDRFKSAEERLHIALNNPEYMLKCWVELPHAPKGKKGKTFRLSLKEAILLALRYNPNVQNAELNRIVERYQLRVAQREFELQYALGGTAILQKTHFSGVGEATNKNFIVTPEVLYKNPLGGVFSINMNNKLAEYGNYDPLVTANFTQPILRGFGKVNQIDLWNAQDTENLNKNRLKQTVINEITDVINAYHNLILSGNTLKSQREQLKDAENIFSINKKRIESGQLEPTANIQQEFQIESLRMLVEQAENDFRISSQKLLQVIGLSSDINVSVPLDVSIKSVIVPDLDKSIETAFKNNTDYIALNLSVKAHERALMAAENEQMWQLDFNANFQTGVTNNVEGSSHGFSQVYNGQNVIEAVGVTLSIPINDIARKHKLISAKVNLEKERLRLNTFKRDMTISITNSVNTIQSLARRLELAKKQVRMAQKAYDLEKKKQQAGLVTSFEVNNSQNQLLLAQIGLINAKIAYLNQISGLQRVLGTTLDEWKIALRYC